MSDVPAHVTLTTDEDDDFLQEFVIEARELLESAEASLLALDPSDPDPESVNAIFRAFHSVKGTAGFMSLTEIGGLAHTAESMLDEVRKGTLPLGSTRIGLFLATVDALRTLTDAVGAGLPQTVELDLPTLLRQIEAARKTEPDGDGSTQEVPTTAPTESTPAGPIPTSAAPTVPVGSADPQEPEVAAASDAPPPEAQPSNTSGPKAPARTDKGGPRKRSAAAGEQTVRLPASRLDALLDTVGELVIGFSMVAEQVERSAVAPELREAVLELQSKVRGVQALSVSMRLFSLQKLFNRAQRQVHDLSRKVGKPVELVVSGGETELDRTLVESLADPLVHMLRNAIDHGLEDPQQRRAAGKAETGRIELRAWQSAGTVVIEVADDGKGLDPKKILARAVERGVVRADATLSDAAICELIFAPGFSTAEQVSDLSGRGVGMDVVRKSIEGVHGRIETRSELGKGTRFQISVPLTAAISEAMLVEVAGERLLIPLRSIRQTFQPTAKALASLSAQGEFVRLREDNLPLVRTHGLLGLEEGPEIPPLLMDVETGSGRCALAIDAVVGQRQVVVKPTGLDPSVVPAFTGAALLGDGSVALVLDPTALVAGSKRPGPTSRTEAA